jgi:AsmA protein
MRALKISAVVLAGLVGFFIIGAVVLVSIFDPNDYKSYATDYVAQRTGRTLSIDEDLKLSFFPWLAIETGGVTIGNAAEFGEQPFATIASVAARVKLLPLLSGAIEVGRIDIEGIELNLGRDEQLRGNWENVTQSAAQASGRETGAGEAAAGGLDVEGIRIRNGTVNWRENRTDLRFVVSNLNFESGAISRGEPIEAELGFNLLDAASQFQLEMSTRGIAELGDEGFAARELDIKFRVVGADAEERASGSAAVGTLSAAGEVVELTGTTVSTRIVNGTRPEGLQLELALDTARYDGAAQTLNFANLETRAGGAAATWQIAGESLADAPHLTGSVRLVADSAASLLSLASTSLPDGVDPATLGPVEVTASFDSSPNTLRFSVTNIVARVLGMQLTGAAELDANVLRANLEAPRFAPSEALYSLAAAVLPEAVDARDLGQLAFRGTIETALDSGRISIRDADAEMLGGTVTGSVTITPSARGSNYSGSIKTSRFAPSAIGSVIASYLPENIDPNELVALSLDTRFNYDAAADRATVSPFAVEAFGLRAAGNATLTAASSAPRVAGDVRVEPFAPRDLLRRFGQPVPQTSDPTALQQATVAGEFDVDKTNGRFANLSVKLDDTTITGSFAVADFANPSYRFDLSADRVDVDRYLPPPTEEAAQGERVAGDIALAAEPLNAFRIDGQARVGDLKLTNLRFQDVATHLAIGDGKATIDSAQAKLYGGEFNGAMFVDTTGEAPTMTLRGQAAGLALNPLIEALTGDANLSGTGSFDIDLTGRGPTVTDNLRTAAGSMGFALRNGAIAGFNLGHVLCQAYNKLQQLPEPPDQPKETRYELIEANATVSDGVATSPELLARAAFMDVTGSGALRLAEQTLDYNLRATLTRSIGIPRCESMDGLIGGSIPFTIKGPVTDAVILPDFAQIIRERAREELRDRLLERLLN